MTQIFSEPVFKNLLSQIGRSSLLFSSLLWISPTMGLSSSSESQYFEQLRIAERKVLRARGARDETRGALGENRSARLAPSGPNLLTSSIPPLYFGRNYRVGDHWQVAALQVDSSMMRMTGHSEHLRPSQGRVGIFRYEVIAVQESPELEFTIRVTQETGENGYGYPAMDPRVTALTLKMDHQTVQTHKEYTFKRLPQPVVVAPEGLRSAITPLERAPLDIPEVATAEKTVPKNFPKLPPELEKAKTHGQQKVDLSRSFWFEQDDFFGRPIQVLWQKGDPWPSYIQTPNGVAILLSKGAS